MRRMFSENQLQEQVKNQLAEGNVNDVKIFEDIVDKDAHARFIEGNITKYTDMPEGLTIEYGKWSLSGTHLIIVVAGNVVNTTVIPNGNVSYINLPLWMMNKIVPVVSNRIQAVSYTFYGEDLSTQNGNGWLKKDENALQLTISSITMSADRTFRLQLDLLIDND